MLRLSRVFQNASEGIKNRLLFSLNAPAECIMKRSPIDSVTVPGVEGAFTLTNNHSQTVAQLGPGVVTVRNGAVVTEYFITNGFAYFKAPSDDSGCCTAEVVGTEIVPVDALDKERIAATLSELLASPRATAWDNARISTGQELLSAALRAAK